MKKCIAILLICLLVISLMTACEKKDSSSSSEKVDGAGAEIPTAAEETEQTQHTPPETFEVTEDADGPYLLSDNSILNILLVFPHTAEASYAMGSALGMNENSVVLVSLDAAHQKIKFTSFHKDIYLDVPSKGAMKLGSVYDEGGAELLISTLEANFSIRIDKFQTLDMQSFPAVINLLGGLDLTLGLEEIKYINAEIDSNIFSGYTTTLSFEANRDTQTVHLDGYQAMFYFMDRGADSLGGNPEYSFNGDSWDRGERQMKLLAAIVKQFAGNMSAHTEWVNSAGKYTATNLSKSDIGFLENNSAKIFSYQTNDLLFPTQNNWQYAFTEDGQSVVSITDYTAVRLDLAKYLYEDLIDY